ncbi:cell wall hydrolase [Alteraurantiacibacter aquimixticola]|uniref:Cell wall hydrolase n=2 Tax=Alteraurantiacibacter aquimixticola TaxID=2489173 RepID=A0A4T3F1R3_9SPHN|nr:cell wall hydrolase [Alteraurantiacibacter aquimixticola]
MTGAVAQDQAEPVALETVTPLAQGASEDAQAADVEAAPVRFVSSAVVQEIPEAPEEPVVEPQASTSLRELVSTVSSAEEMSTELRCLAQAVYFESRGEPLAGQLAVARVVINRSESRLFPNDYCSVVTQRAQFSFVRAGRIPTPNASSQAWRRAKAIARIAHQELWDSEAADSLYFHATHVSPRWARAKASVARIDSHIFYR